MANEIEIVVRVKDQASAQTAAIAEKIRQEMKAAKGGGEAVKVPVEPDTTDFEEEVKTKTRRTRPEPVKVPLEVPTEDFEADFRKAMNEGEKAVADAERAMRGSFTSMESGSRSLRAAMQELEPAAHEAGSGIDEAGRKANDAGHRAESGGSGFSLAAGRMALMTAAALSLIPALAALPAIGGAVVVGAATMSLGFGGVIKALRDYGEQSASAGQSGAQLAATEFSNAVAIRNAQQAIADAKKQAARTAEDSAEQIKNAQQGVVDAERSAATAAQSSADQIASAQRSVASSAYSLAQAEQRLEDAEKSELDAQKTLTQARKDAANEMADINNAAADSHLAVERATQNVADAQANLSKVLGSTLSTDSQKKDAQLSLREAQQALIDAKQRDIEVTQKADDANKAGVDGMQSVVAAQDAVTKAARGVADAQHGVAEATQAQADAQKALARATESAAQQQISSAQSVAKAEQALADAQRSADRQRQDSMESVAKAEQNLADTYKQQQLAAAAAASAGGGAANKFAQDMAALTPAGQAFVKQLLSMKDGVHQLSQTAQTAMLPGLTKMLQDSGPMLPIFNDAVKTMGGVVGGTAEKFGKLMQSPAFQGALVQVLKEGAGFAKDLGDGLVGMVDGVMQAAARSGPVVDGLGKGIKTLMTSGIPDFFAGLANNAGGIGQAFQGVLTLVSNLAGPLGTVSGALLSALAPAIQELSSPQVKQSLDSVAQSLSKIILALSPLVALFAKGLAQVLKSTATDLGILAKVVDQNRGLIDGLSRMLGGLSGAFTFLSGPMAGVHLGLKALAAISDFAHDHFATLKSFIQRMWSDVKAWFADGVHAVEVAWDKIVSAGATAWGKVESGAKTAWGLVKGYIINPITEAYTWLQGKWGNIVTDVTGLPGKLKTAGAGMWDWIKESFKSALNTVIGWWNSMKFTTPTVHIPGTPWNIDGVTIGVPQIPTFKAIGGPLGMGGLAAIIGEAGPEIMTLPNGTQIMPNANTRSLAAQGAGTPGVVKVELDWAPGSSHGDELLTWLRRSIRIVAGNDPNSVQRALGQAF